jgi:hypothetical protein
MVVHEIPLKQEWRILSLSCKVAPNSMLFWQIYFYSENGKDGLRISASKIRI